MRRLILSAALASAALVAGTGLTTGVRAAPIAPSTAIQDATRSLDPVQDVRYVCRRAWRHGGWHRRCWWEPNRRGWRHRHWHRRWR